MSSSIFSSSKISSQSLLKKLKENPNKNYDNNTNISSISKKADMSFLDKYLLDEENRENKRITAEYYKLVRIDELINCILLLMTLSSSFIYNETKFCTDDCAQNEEIKNEIINISLIFSSIASFLFIIILGFKYNHYFSLYKHAKYLPHYANFFKTSLFKHFLIEFFFALFHPNLLLKIHILLLL